MATIDQHDESAPPPGESARSGRRTRRKVVVAAAVVVPVLFVVGVVFGVRQRDAAPLRVTGHGAAKPIDLPNLRAGGPGISLSAFRGRPVVVNFFASWCVPCRREMPALQAVSRSVTGRVAFVGVDHQDSRRLALALLHDTGVTYPAAYDPAGKVAASYGLFGMPTTLFVSADGRLLERRTGELRRDELEATIERLFHVTPRAM